MPKKRCILINQTFVGPVGSPLVVYGHKFIIQKDGSAIAEIDDAFIKEETNLNRFKVIKDSSAKVEPMPRKDLLTDFGFEIENLFGTNDINKLYKKIKKFDKNQAILFAETRLNLNLPDDMPQIKMVKKISETIKLQTNPPKTKKETLDDLNELEAKFNKGQ